MSSVFLHWHVSENPLTASPLATPVQHGSLLAGTQASYPSFVQLGPGESARFLPRSKSLRRLMSSTIATTYCGEFLAIL